MKAIAYQQFGNTEVLQMVEEATPSIQPQQVLVKVKAVSLNPMDWKIRKGEMKLMSGTSFPKHTGVDFAGVIEELGASVSNFAKGDEVFGVVKNNMKEGALAEYVAVPADKIWRKPAEVDFAQAASLPIVGAAAVAAFNKMGNISSSTQILINGASGGFGMILLQLLRNSGAQVTAVTNTKGLAFAKQWGATATVDYTKEDVLKQKARYDVIVDLSGKMGYGRARAIMKQKAMFINPTPKPIDIPLTIVKNVFRYKKHIVLLSAPSAENMGVLLNAIAKGLHIEVSKLFPFAQYKEAYQYAEKGGIIGKAVIEVQ